MSVEVIETVVLNHSEWSCPHCYYDDKKCPIIGKQLACLPHNNTHGEYIIYELKDKR